MLFFAWCNIWHNLPNTLTHAHLPFNNKHAVKRAHDCPRSQGTGECDCHSHRKTVEEHAFTLIPTPYSHQHHNHFFFPFFNPHESFITFNCSPTVLTQYLWKLCPCYGVGMCTRRCPQSSYKDRKSSSSLFPLTVWRPCTFSSFIFLFTTKIVLHHFHLFHRTLSIAVFLPTQTTFSWLTFFFHLDNKKSRREVIRMPLVDILEGSSTASTLDLRGLVQTFWGTQTNKLNHVMIAGQAKRLVQERRLNWVKC